VLTHLIDGTRIAQITDSQSFAEKIFERKINISLPESTGRSVL